MEIVRGTFIDAVEKLPVKEPVFLPEKPHIVLIHILRELLIKGLPELSGLVHKLTELFVGSLKVKDPYYGCVLTLKLGNIAQLESVKAEDEGNLLISGCLYDVIDHSIQSIISLHPFKIHCYNDHFKVLSIQMLHYFLHSHYVTLLKVS